MMIQGIIRTKHFEPVNRTVQAFSQVPHTCQNLLGSALRVSVRLPKQSFQFQSLVTIYWTSTKNIEIFKESIHSYKQQNTTINDGNQYRSLNGYASTRIFV